MNSRAGLAGLDDARYIGRMSQWGDDGSAFGDPEEVLKRLESQIAAANEIARKAKDTQAQIAAATGTAYSPDRIVTVESDASGRIVRLDIKEAAADGSMSSLARKIQETAGVAQRKAGEHALQIMSEALGEDSPVTLRLRQEIADKSRRGVGGDFGPEARS